MIRLNEIALQHFLESPSGPVGQDLQRRAERVTAEATANASGDIIGIESGALHSGINFRIEQDADGLRAVIGTPANKAGFSYPAFHDRHDRPWLTEALRSFDQ